MPQSEFTFDDLKRWLRYAALGLIAAAALTYATDYVVWRVRPDRMGTISVSRIVVAPLKGGKEEYYPDGTADVPCSRSLFPQGGANACWWVARDPVVYDR